VGCIFGELLLLLPLFAADAENDVAQVKKIVEIKGLPTDVTDGAARHRTWPGHSELPWFSRLSGIEFRGGKGYPFETWEGLPVRNRLRSRGPRAAPPRFTCMGARLLPSNASLSLSLHVGSWPLSFYVAGSAPLETHILPENASPALFPGSSATRSTCSTGCSNMTRTDAPPRSRRAPRPLSFTRTPTKQHKRLHLFLSIIQCQTKSAAAPAERRRRARRRWTTVTSRRTLSRRPRRRSPSACGSCLWRRRQAASRGGARRRRARVGERSRSGSQESARQLGRGRRGEGAGSVAAGRAVCTGQI